MVFGVRLDVPEKMAPRDRQGHRDLLDLLDHRDLRVRREPLQHPLMFHRLRHPHPITAVFLLRHHLQQQR